MRVQDLIDELKSYDPEAEVHFHYNYGDHWRTEVAPKVTEVFDAPVVWSEYHRMPKLADDDYYDDEDGCGEDLQQNARVVIIG